MLRFPLWRVPRGLLRPYSLQTSICKNRHRCRSDLFTPQAEEQRSDPRACAWGREGGGAHRGSEESALPASCGRCASPESFERKVASWTAWSCRCHSDSAARKSHGSQGRSECIRKTRGAGRVVVRPGGWWRGQEGGDAPNPARPFLSSANTQSSVPWGLQEAASFGLSFLSR